MVLRSKTIRLGIFVSAVIIAAILLFQLIWLKKVYRYEQKGFNHGIVRAVRGFYEDVGQSLDQSFLSQLITLPNEQTFFVRIANPNLNRDSLVFYLQSELEDENIFTDCYLGLYDGQHQRYAFTAFLPGAAGAKKQSVILPASGLPQDHLTLFFPHRSQYLLSRMNLWIVSTVILLAVLLLFGASLYYFYRQKFLNETQKDFVSNFTHEFKTPVSVINLAAAVLANPATAEKPDKLARYAAIVRYQGKYLQDQIERLLQHTKADTNILRLKKQKVNLHQLIHEALENLQPLIRDKDAQIDCLLDAEYPELIADRGYLLIVVTNLIENALKYAASPQIIIQTMNTENRIVFSVKDNGRGIEKKYRKKIFRKFYRVPDKEETPARGFGLGLAFVKRIVQAHAGSITVDSIPGIGSDFQTSLPVN
jgi:two-component system phosphate regulon sensor histidine kinase PhoR